VRRAVAQEGTSPLVIHHVPPKVVYERVASATEEHIEVTARTRLALETLTEDDVEALGFADLGDVVDTFCTDHGGLPGQTVWLIEFRLATDLPLILAWPNSGKAGHDDYVSNPGANDALTREPEAIDKGTLDDYAAHARRNRTPAGKGPDEVVRLEGKLKEIRRRELTGVNASLERAVVERQLADEHKAREAKAA
jgi:hypothetical protein